MGSVSGQRPRSTSFSLPPTPNMSRSIAARMLPREPSARRASTYAATPGVVPSSAVVQSSSIDRRGASSASADPISSIVPRPLPLSFAPGWRPWSRCATTTIRSSGHSVPRRTPLTFQEWTVGITLSTTSRARACPAPTAWRSSAPSIADTQATGIWSSRNRRARFPLPASIDIRYGQGSGWITIIAARAAGGRKRNERPEPETRVAEAQLLHDGDLPSTSRPVVVGLLARADEHELALDAAVRRRGREVRRNDVERAAVGELELGDVVPVAERRELTVLDLEAELPELAPHVVGRPGVPFRADEAVSDADEPLDAGDRAGAADSRPQLQFGRREHERDRIAGRSDPSSRANRV